jgi:hypothetical protein
MRRKYPGYVTEEDIANVASHDMDVPAEIGRLIGQKYRFLVCISKKWRSATTSNVEDLSFQVNRIEETYKSDLPPINFGVASRSGGASSSAGGTRTQLPPISPATPPTLRSNPNQAIRAGYGSHVGKVCSLRQLDITFVFMYFQVCCFEY